MSAVIFFTAAPDYTVDIVSDDGVTSHHDWINLSSGWKTRIHIAKPRSSACSRWRIRKTEVHTQAQRASSFDEEEIPLATREDDFLIGLKSVKHQQKQPSL